MAIYAALRGFVQAHRGHGVLRGDAEPPTAAGYRLWVACPCGARFERWVIESDAEADLLRSALMAFEN
jgi:hypothetical protein